MSKGPATGFTWLACKGTIALLSCAGGACGEGSFRHPTRLEQVVFCTGRDHFTGEATSQPTRQQVLPLTTSRHLYKIPRSIALCPWHADLWVNVH